MRLCDISVSDDWHSLHTPDRQKQGKPGKAKGHITSSFLSIPSPESGGKQKPRRTVADSSHFNGWVGTAGIRLPIWSTRRGVNRRMRAVDKRRLIVVADLTQVLSNRLKVKTAFPCSLFHYLCVTVTRYFWVHLIVVKGNLIMNAAKLGWKSPSLYSSWTM